MSDVYLPNLLKQKAVLWRALGTDNAGNDLYDTPVQIRCRWEQNTEVFLDRMNQQQVSKSIVFIDRDAEDKDILWLGKLANLTDLSVPFNNPDAWAIQRMDKVPNAEGKKFLRKAYL